MGDFFGQVQLPDWTQINALFSPDAVALKHNQALASSYLPQQANLEVQGAQQDLTDRATLRDLAPGLTAGTPSAIVGAAVLPKAGGVNTLNALDAFNANRINTGIALGQAWGALPQGMSPPQAPWLGQAVGGAPRNALLPQLGAEDSFVSALGQREGGNNAAVVNKQGYNGQYQFGAPRLQDLNVYQPAPGEITNGKWNGQTNGTFNIPGFPQVKTQQDFLNNPDAQRAVMHAQVADLMTTAQNTPGADKFDPVGLLAVGHLGGPQGMVNFIKSGGAYNPADANGTHLSSYYQKFAGNPQTLQAAAGHPSGPLPDDHPALQHPAYQVATAAATQGMPAIQNDASAPATPPPAASQPAAPADAQVSVDPSYNGPRGAVAAHGQTMSTQEAVAQAQRDLTGKIETMSPDDQNNAIIARAQQIMAAPPAQAPVAAAAAPQQIAALQAAPSAGTQQGVPAAAQQSTPQPQAAQPWQPAVPPGFTLLRSNLGMPLPGGQPGYGVAVNQQTGERLPVRITPPELKFEKTPTEIIGTDPNTGQVVSRVPITETGRQALVPTSDGNQVWINAHPTGQTIPYSGRPEQNEAYKDDKNSVRGIIGIAQQAQAIAPRLNEMADLAKQLYTGPTAEVRGKAQAYLESMGVDPAAASRLTGMSNAAAYQEFVKLGTSTAGAAAKDDLGANNGVQAMGIYMAANPGPGLMQGANVNITNMLRVLNQSKQDYAQAALQHFNGAESAFLNSDGKGAKQYTPMTSFNQQWLAQNNPHVYAAAMGMLNGDPFDKWSARLSDPAEGARAASIVSRIDPTAMIPVKGGMIPVRQLLSKVTPAQAQ